MRTLQAVSEPPENSVTLPSDLVIAELAASGYREVAADLERAQGSAAPCALASWVCRRNSKRNPQARERDET